MLDGVPGRPPPVPARLAWLRTVAAWSGDHPGGGVVTCPAQRHDSRDRLRDTAPATVLPHLAGHPHVVSSRVAEQTRPVDELTHCFGVPAVATTTGGTR